MSKYNLKSALILCYLTACSLHNITPNVSGLDEKSLEEIYRLSKIHSMTSIIYHSLEKTDIFSSYPLLKQKWKTDREKALRKNVLLDAERKKLLSFMESRKIWYLPLKGSVIKLLYPTSDMRQMSDNDILFDAERRSDIKEYFENNGYKTEFYCKTNHDVYIKPPVYNFEMHAFLFANEAKPEIKEYFNSINSRLVKCEGKDYEYSFNNEDFYLFFIAHSFKHYRSTGMGLRFLVDMYLIIKKYNGIIDREYIDLMLKKMNMAEFEVSAKVLCQKLFQASELVAEDDLDSEQQKMLAYISSNGVYGCLDNLYINKIREFQKDDKPVSFSTKVKYYWKKLFKCDEFYYKKYPFCLKHKWTKLFFRFYHPIYILFSARERLIHEFKIIKSIDKE